MPRATSKAAITTEKGLVIERRFTSAGTHPYDELEWETRDAIIGDPAKPAFEQRRVEFPTSWSQNATNIVAQKYFRGQPGSPERETSVKQMVSRVADRITEVGREQGYFATDEDADAFDAELTSILVNQKAAFNSPVWFNVGWKEPGQEQASACFILSVEDDMDSILSWNTKEGIIFKGGSGSGINLSKIRGSMEHLSKGGIASGPVSFMRGADSWAGAIKSGGGTRRAAKMVVLDVDHPDIEKLHLVQGRRGEEGRRAEGRRLRHAAGLRRLRLGPVPERQQLGSRHRRVHAGGRERRGLGPDRPRRRHAGQDRQGACADGPDRGRRLAVRGPGHPVRHDDQQVAHGSRTPGRSPRRIPAPSTCRSTTRPATSLRSTS